MVGFRGRFGSIQYMPQKPTNGASRHSLLLMGLWLLNVLLYTGAQTLENADPAFAALPVPGRVVMDVLEPYLNRGHHAFTDRYYSSIPLTKELLSHGTLFTGTIMKNRIGLPAELRSSAF